MATDPSQSIVTPPRLGGVSPAVIRALVQTLVKRREDQTLVDVTAEEAAAVYDEHHAHRLAALFEAAFLMAAADGELAQIEVEELGRAMVAITEGKLTEEEAYRLLNEYLVAYKRDGFRARLARVTEVLADAEWRRAAVQLAARIAYADGSIEPTEESAFRAFGRSFGLPAEEVSAIVERVLRPGQR